MNLLQRIFAVTRLYVGSEKSLVEARKMIPLIAKMLENERGAIGMNIMVAVIGVVVTIVVLANAIPVLWPIATSASGNITAMTGTDAGTTTIQAFWPIALLLVGLGVAVGVIYYALRSFGLIS